MCLLLLFGGLTTIGQNTYLQFTTKNFPGYKGYVVPFTYSQVGNIYMFLAMFCVGIMWIYKVKKYPQQNQDKPKPTTVCTQLLSNPWIILISSAFFDLIASGLMSVGLNLGVPGSVYQMLNGSIVLFVPILSYIFLKDEEDPTKRRKITKQQGVGMIIVCIGLIVVGLSSYFVQEYFTDSINSADSKPVTAGNLILAQIIYAGQFVVEEYSMKLLSALPEQVVCIEGLWGLWLALFWVSPILAIGHYENDFDAFVFMGAEPMVLIPTLIFIFAVALYNMYGQTVTKVLSANHRTILEGLRALVVWIFGLIERAIFSGTMFGEAWNGWASWVELVGFVIQLCGSLIFYNIIKFKCLQTKKHEQQSQEIQNQQETV